MYGVTVREKYTKIRKYKVELFCCECKIPMEYKAHELFADYGDRRYGKYKCSSCNQEHSDPDKYPKHLSSEDKLDSYGDREAFYEI